MDMSYEEVLQTHLDSILAELNAMEEIRRRKREKRLKKIINKIEKKKKMLSQSCY
jgi:hypothetical protein